MRGLLVRAFVIAVAVAALEAPAHAQKTFAAGSLIIPMDVDYQNSGMLKAYGLLYQLLHAGVPVSWCIAPSKSLYTGTTAFPASAAGAVDFTASATDLHTGAAISSHGYRGGPFVIDSSNAATALPIARAWTTTYPSVAVHQATAPFTATVSRQLVNAPNIGMNQDGNEIIAFGYLNAAAIPASNGSAWPTAKAASYPGYPEVMTPAEIAGPTTTNHHDGSLFDSSGTPLYCQIMSMHWGVTERNEETVAEMRSFLQYPTHLFAECQAVNTIEDAVAGHFLTTDNGNGEPMTNAACASTTLPNNGICTAAQPSTLSYFNSDLPFAQLDGAFKTVGGSEPGYGTVPGPPLSSGAMTAYYDSGIVMMRNSTTSTVGVDDLWMTGVLNGICLIGGDFSGTSCATYGKISYLGGHQYTTAVPILANPSSQGVRLFLNSLFEAGCTTTEGAPNVTLAKTAPASTTSPLVTYTLTWSNAGPGIAVGATLTDKLPAGAAFVSASGGGTDTGGVVSWSLGELGPSTTGSVTVTVSFGSYGTYGNTATVAFTVGTTKNSASSNTTTTTFAPPPDMGVSSVDAGSKCAGVTCAPPANPCQQAACDSSTGVCALSTKADGTACSTGNACIAGQTCTAGSCGGGTAVTCPTSANPCQTIACAPAKGCVTSNVADGTACSSGDQCVTGQTCTAGSCGGGASVMCPASLNPCEITTCAPATGCGFAAVANGTPCPSGSACVTGTTCAGGVCGGGTGTVCPPPSAPCTIMTCDATAGCVTSFAAAGTDPNSDCTSAGACTSTCNGAGACTVTCVGPGSPCSSDAACSTGHCADGVCCDTACTSLCHACNLAGSAGTCTVVANGTDPKAQCGAGMVCNGMGGCRSAATADASPANRDAGASARDGGSRGDARAASDGGRTSSDQRTTAGDSGGSGGRDGSRAGSHDGSGADPGSPPAGDAATGGGGGAARPHGCGCAIGAAPEHGGTGSDLALALLLLALPLAGALRLRNRTRAARALRDAAPRCASRTRTSGGLARSRPAE